MTLISALQQPSPYPSYHLSIMLKIRLPRTQYTLYVNLIVTAVPLALKLSPFLIENVSLREEVASPSSWLKERSWMTSLVWVWSRSLQPWVMSQLPLQETLGRVAESGLPALLLQCLYLFFVFPLEKDELLESDVQAQRMFVQVSRGRARLPGPRPGFFLVH